MKQDKKSNKKRKRKKTLRISKIVNEAENDAVSDKRLTTINLLITGFVFHSLLSFLLISSFLSFVT